jgi:hypothetical protein
VLLKKCLNPWLGWHLSELLSIYLMREVEGRMQEREHDENAEFKAGLRFRF